MGHALSIDIVVEGVETPEDAEVLRMLGCRFAQGYLYGRPMPASALPAWLAAGVPLALGSDSHVSRQWAEELRWLEYGQRLHLQQRNVAAAPAQQPATAARLFNAVVKLQRPVREVVQDFDSVSVCLSKGLGAPVGSVLAGSKTLVARARRWRKVLGGGMRQA
eukprot:gene3755-4692_t